MNSRDAFRPIARDNIRLIITDDILKDVCSHNPRVVQSLTCVAFVQGKGEGKRPPPPFERRPHRLANHLLVIFTGVKLSWYVSGCNVVPEAKIHELFSPIDQSTTQRKKTAVTLDITSKDKGGKRYLE